MKKKKTNQKPLTLGGLANYNQNVLFPFLEEKFLTKKEFGLFKKIDFSELKKDVNDLEGDFQNFKNEVLTNQDMILEKLDILLTEKTVREYQEKKQKKLWAIIIKALKEHRFYLKKN
jgi:hypothetical protein